MAWKTFKFFEKEILKDPETKQPFEDLADLSVTCVTGGRGQIVVGDAHGRLHFLSLSGGQVRMNILHAYQNTVLHLLQLKQSNLLISVGFDDSEHCMIKIWDSAKLDRGGGAPIRTIKPQLLDKKPVQITCIAVDERQSLLAVGYVNGVIVLIKGNFVRYWSSKQVILPTHAIIERPITGLAFSSWKQDTFLFITTEKNVFSFRLTVNPSEQCLTTLGEFGCRQGCCVMSDSSHDNKFVVASNEVTSFYLPKEAAQCFGFEGIKLMVNWFRGHLLEVKKLDRPAATPSTPVGAKEQNVLTVYDIQNQFIAFSTTFPSTILGVVPEWGMINVLTSDGRITHLKEHDTQSKLESLFKRNLFDYAVSLARNQSYDDGLAEILRRYGDHLYSKGDFRGAIEQYKNAIRYIEPSYVIRKFLDAQQIENLTSYLKALHNEGIAKSDHTTLLLNCYTKLQDEAKLEEFIRQCRPESFDVEAAIRVCRQAGFHKHAVELAHTHAHHNLYVLIQVEDLKKFKEALLYIERLSFDEAQTHIKKYGKSLMAAEPDLTASLITSLCLGHWKQDGRTTKHAKPEEFIHIFVNQPERLVRFLESSVQTISKCSPAVYNTLLELYLSKDATKHTKLTDKQRERKIMVLLEAPEANYDVHHALVLAEMHDFQAAVLYLYEHKLKMYQPILQFHMEHQNEDKVMDTCRRYGKQDNNLWVSALQHFAHSSSSKNSEYIKETLDYIERYNLLPPLMVIEILSKSKHTKLGDVKDYIASKLHQENDAIAKDEKQIAQFQEETAKMKGHLEELRSKARVFQVMRCEACKSGLRLPAVHFLCQHSYHLNCLEDSDDGKYHCPVCAEDNQTVIAILQQLDAVSNVDEDFHRQLERKRGDGFSVVADYFGRGVMNKTSGKLSSTPSP